jgi:sphingomyelin phosphodiesterase 2
MFSYPLNGSPLHVGEGDWHVGKGAASAVLEVDRIGEVEVFNTHVS